VVLGGTREIPLSGLIGALSYALDVTEGEPPGHAVRSCLIGMRLADELGLGAGARSDLFYALLLKDAGCSANSARMAALFGADDHAAKRTSKRVDWARPFSAFVWSLRTVAPGGSLRARAERVLAILHGTEIPLAARVLCLAQTVEIFHAERGVGAAYRVAARRAGQWFDPALVDALGALRADTGFWASLAEPDLAGVEPPDRVLVADENRLDQIAEAFAGVIDAKSPWTRDHSDRACAIATGIAAELSVEAAEVRDLRRAARLHDIGKLAISNRILDRPGRLTDEEYANVRQHPVVTHRILERVPGFSELAPVASAHHERLEGSGYPHGLSAGELTIPMRVLAVADVYEALTAERPYRPAWSSDRALEIIRLDVPQRLDHDAFAALNDGVAAAAALPLGIQPR
jgi:HD-GYP domain-containing protein (c-di-GMP phosphodiesterase class II)